jgi:hypothetical protein
MLRKKICFTPKRRMMGAAINAPARYPAAFAVFIAPAFA